MLPKSALLSFSHEGQRPKNVKEVDGAMSEMDEKFGTHFVDWIRSENNVGYICTFKKPIFHEYLATNPSGVATAIRWLSGEWGVATVAELLLKLFYVTRLDSALFANIVQAVSVDWPKARQLDLFNILLIGETPSTMACFFDNITRGISFTDGNGNPEYDQKPWMMHEKESFLAAYIQLVFCDDTENQEKLKMDVIETFKSTTDDCTALCLALFMDIEEEAMNDLKLLSLKDGGGERSPYERCDSKLDLI
ncbi:hypothetical protein HDU97_000664 [Phlyctochytrium planicorne]|nr:hypothetical protein HDU97_000664 [Phlyctochytrium planicorne]